MSDVDAWLEGFQAALELCAAELQRIPAAAALAELTFFLQLVKAREEREFAELLISLESLVNQGSPRLE